MSVDGKTFLKLAWVMASAACFIFPLLLIPFDNLHSWTGQITGDMIFGMVVLTFPAGLLYLLAVGCVLFMLSPSELPVSFYVLLWFGFFVTGYLQWFHFLPDLLERRSLSSKQSLTTLGLSEGNDKGKGDKSRRARRRRRASQTQLTDRQVLQFEETRLTPLERVISERSHKN